MEENDSFITETDAEYCKRATVKPLIVSIAVLALAAALGLLISVNTFLTFEALVVIVCIVSAINLGRRNYAFELRFDNDRLTVINIKTKEKYEFSDVSVNDFIINQTGKEKTADYCSLTVRNTMFSCGGVKKCEELKEYIKNHFKNGN